MLRQRDFAFEIPLLFRLRGQQRLQARFLFGGEFLAGEDKNDFETFGTHPQADDVHTVNELHVFKDQPVLIHLLSPQELAPDLAGDLELIDSENGETVPASLTPETLARYRERLQTWCGELERYCVARRIPYVRLSTAMPLEEAVLGELRRRRLVA